MQHNIRTIRKYDPDLIGFQAYQVFMEHGYVDTYRAAGHGDSAASSTFHGLRDAEPPVYPSDHYPVVAEVLLAS